MTDDERWKQETRESIARLEAELQSLTAELAAILVGHESRIEGGEAARDKIVDCLQRSEVAHLRDALDRAPRTGGPGLLDSIIDEIEPDAEAD